MKLVRHDVFGILQPGEMYGTEPRYGEARDNEILIVTNAIQNPKRTIYTGIIKKCQHVTKKRQPSQEEFFNSKRSS